MDKGHVYSKRVTAILGTGSTHSKMAVDGKISPAWHEQELIINSAIAAQNIRIAQQVCRLGQYIN